MGEETHDTHLPKQFLSRLREKAACRRSLGVKGLDRMGVVVEYFIHLHCIVAIVAISTHHYYVLFVSIRKYHYYSAIHTGFGSPIQLPLL